MADLNNNLNVGGVHQGYTANFKQGSKTEPTVEQKTKDEAPKGTSLDNDPKAVSGKAMLYKSSSANFKADMTAFQNNPKLAKHAMNACDTAYELMDAQGVADAYAKACTGALNAACDKCK